MLRRVPCRSHGALLGHGPQKAKQCPGKSDDDWGHVFPAGEQRALPLTEPHLGLPADLLDALRWGCESQLSMPPDGGGVAIGPGPLDQRPPGMALASFGQRALLAPRPPGGCRGRQASIGHEVAGGGEAGAVTACGHRGDRDGKRHAAQGLERFDPGRSTPGGAVCMECLFETLQTFRGLADGADICLKDHWLRRGRPDPVREPPEMGRVPGGSACIT